jgi:hypothetical protein
MVTDIQKQIKEHKEQIKLLETRHKNELRKQHKKQLAETRKLKNKISNILSGALIKELEKGNTEYSLDSLLANCITSKKTFVLNNINLFNDKFETIVKK